jgi:hypothetical protein
MLQRQAGGDRGFARDDIGARSAFMILQENLTGRIDLIVEGGAS